MKSKPFKLKLRKSDSSSASPSESKQTQEILAVNQSLLDEYANSKGYRVASIIPDLSLTVVASNEKLSE